MSMLSAVRPKVAPSAATSITLTSGGASWTFGAWVQLLAATAGDAVLLGIAWSGSALGSVEIEIGVGGAGSEVAIAAHRFTIPNPGNGADGVFWLPKPISGIASGGRIAARVRGNVSSATTIGCAVMYAESWDAESTATPLKAVPSGSAGVTVTPAGTAWANSAWVELSSALSAEASVYGLTTGILKDSGASDAEWDIGTGAAGAEAVITTLRNSSNTGGSSSGALRCEMYTPDLYPIAVGTRVAVRLRKSGTDTSTMVAALLVYEGTALAGGGSSAWGPLLAGRLNRLVRG